MTNLRQICLALLTLAAVLPARAQAPTSTCAQLESQLAALDRDAETGRAEQIERYEDDINKQQFELDRLIDQSQRIGCERSGFFLFLGRQPEQCGPLNARIQRARANLDRLHAELDRLTDEDRAEQRGAILRALAQNSCGPQYRAAVAAAQPRGVFGTLFGNIPFLGNNAAPSTPTPFSFADPTQSYRTLCVRICDGYYFPISFAVAPVKFPEDEQACKRQCPGAETALYYHRNPGEDASAAVSLAGRPYSELPTAFRYRQEYNAACSCRRPGDSWAQTLKNVDDRAMLERGDILVDEQRAKLLSQPKADAKGGVPKPDASAKSAPAATPPAAPAASSTAPSQASRKRTVRTVGPPFYPTQ